MRFESKGVELYLAKKLVDGLPPPGGPIKILMGDYGTRTIRVKR